MHDFAFSTSDCLMTRTMGVVGGKWKLIIIFHLAQEHVRFGQLAQRIPLISSKVLAEQLKELEKDGLVVREAFAEVPPRVEYHLTPHGLELLPISQQLCHWHEPLVPAADNAG